MSRRNKSEELGGKSTRKGVDRRTYLRSLGATGSGLMLGGASTAAFQTGSVRAEPEIIEDFERAAPLDDYSGHTSLYSVTTNSSENIEGTKTLKAISDYGELAHDTVGTPRGYEYRAQIKLGNDTTEPSLLTCVQDTSAPKDDCYWAHLDRSSSTLRIARLNNSSYTLLAKESLPSLEIGVIYHLAVEMGSETIKALLYDSSGDKAIAETPTVSDDTWSNGQLGFYTGGSGGYPAYFDSVTKELLGGTEASASNIIDDFEDGSLAEYSHDPTRSNSAAKIGSIDDGYPTHSGSNVLAIEDTNTEMISLPGDGLVNYPSSGDSFGCWTRATTSDANANFSYGVQDHENRYYVKLLYEQDRIYLFKYLNGGGEVLGKDTDAPLEPDAWYRIVIHWGQDGSHEIELIHENGERIAHCFGTDSEWETGGIGFDAYLGSGGAVYFDRAILHEAPGGGTSYLIEYFESGTIDRKYSGQNDNSVTEINDDRNYVFRGDYSVKLDRGTGESGKPGTLYTVGPRTDHFEHLPEAGEKFSVLMDVDEYARPNIFYGISDNHDERYLAQINDDGFYTKYSIWKQVRDGSWDYVWGDSRKYDQTESHFADPGWYEFEIDWREDGTHVFTVYLWDDYTERGGKTELGSLTATGDSSLTDGGFGYRSNRGPLYVDNVHVGDGYPINYDLSDSGTAFASPDIQVDYYKSTELVEYSPDPISGVDNWGVTFEIGQFGATTNQNSDDLEPYIDRQSIEVTYSERNASDVITPKEQDWFAAHNFNTGSDASAATVAEDVLDHGVDIVGTALSRRLDVATVATEFLINSTDVAGYGTESFTVEWDYANDLGEAKRIAGTYAKFRALLSPGAIFEFDVTATTDYKNGKTVEDSFHWTTGVPSEGSG